MSTQTTTDSDRRKRARFDAATEAVQSNVYWAMGAGVLPMPLFDLVAIVGIQLKMIRELSHIYGVRYREATAKKAVTALLVGVGGVGIGGLIGVSVAKLIPVVGLSLGVASTPVISGMLTNAVGQTFMRHFEAGGTLADFDAKKTREFFREQYARSREVIADTREQPEPKPSTT